MSSSAMALKFSLYLYLIMNFLANISKLIEKFNLAQYQKPKVKCFVFSLIMNEEILVELKYY